ncbi:YraN family protein [Candidatus Nitrotoga fabula]|uniref:UPF0102 protein NTGZN8_340051 n=1 Tax=Candidatus Nitrotoga fabula TaxID=2182327 RepID=A0A916BDN4_9PROT|nr:YraN family protein [Candidatus Nitrotoga fabula]CAE6725322.1 conserved hypothetical protein [Candidatus Nitrotoga fabula]
MSTRGETAELLAAQYLSNQGLKLLKRNYRCRHGEIDLILQDGDTLVFAEVRLRSHNHYGGAAASINAAKQKRLIRTAQHYLATLGYTPPCRFDALLFHNLDNGWPEWIRNAFTT